jgi:hypothetical protein
MKSLIPNENAVIENGWNVMLIGAHGTGKSATVRSIAKRHNMKVAVYNCATMDPHTELLGIPMPRMLTVYDGATGLTETREVLRMIRPEQINDCQIVFLDELNRAPVETQNACMEMANERTINGEPLPNLRCVMTAINPPDGNYNVGLIDDAMVDRWKLYVEVEPVVDADILVSFDGIARPIADALAKWYTECNHAKRETYVSPRKVRDLGQVFEATKSKKMLQCALPPGTTADIGKLFAMLMEAAGTPLAGSAADAKLASIGSQSDSEQPAAPASPVEWVLAKHMNPVMVHRVEKVALAHPDLMAKHIIDMRQSTFYRYGVKLGAMLYGGNVTAPEISAVISTYNRAATTRGGKSVADHMAAAASKAAGM